MDSERTFTVRISEDQARQRLDKALADKTENISRMRLKALIEQGHVLRCSGSSEVSVVDPSSKVKPGETYQITLPPPVPAEPAAEEIRLDVVYEDEALIVINKPAGLVVHPAPGSRSGTLVNALLAHCGDSLSGIGGVARPGIVHRIDKDTSGLLVVAKSDTAHMRLAQQFAEHSITRAYSAICWGALTPRAGTINQPLGRSQANRKKIAVRRDGKSAVTHYQSLQVFGGQARALASLLRCELETGRTHQIRVHLAHKGHPIIGDPVYGTGRTVGADAPETLRTFLNGFKRQALHAGELGFIHPLSGNELRFESVLPDDMQELLGLLSDVK
ncbi:MAG: RluA family pseudouridine synthase [Alphaproteobacteria bacterium]|nr:RluA family pseudouridine synthase [Alphaproteobacteria bacterium]